MTRAASRRPRRRWRVSAATKLERITRRDTSGPKTWPNAPPRIDPIAVRSPSVSEVNDTEVWRRLKPIAILYAPVRDMTSVRCYLPAFQGPKMKSGMGSGGVEGVGRYEVV